MDIVRGRIRTRRAPADGYARHPGDAVRLVAGAAILLLTTAAIHQNRLGSREAALFRVVNDLALPGWTWPGIWLVMQLGVIGAVPLVAGLAFATRRLRLALDAVLAAGSIYLIAKVIKGFVERGRPDSLVDEVHILGAPAGGLGYLSGHAAVAVALATVSAPYLRRGPRRIAWVLAAAVCLARVYVGAHLPFDVVGGAALGWSAGALVHLALGAPEIRPGIGRVLTALRGHGLDIADLRALRPSAGRSTRFVSTGRSGGDVFVKVVVPEWRDTDLVYRTWRRLRRARLPVRHGAPVNEVEHEGLMILAARATGVRAPDVLLVTGIDRGAGLLVEQLVHGRPLAQLGADEIDDTLVADIRRQVALLHQRHIAHQDLTADNILKDAAGEAWLVDFDQAVTCAGPRSPAADRDRQMLATTLQRLGADPSRTELRPL